MTVGVKYEWKCLQDKAKSITKPYIIENETIELDKFNTFTNLNIDEIVNKNEKQLLKKKQAKFIIINTFPKLFQVYLKIRRKF